MAKSAKDFLQAYVLEALVNLGGVATVTEIAKSIWNSHETELRASGDIFYTWQYDMRWAAQTLQNSGKLQKNGKRHAWSLIS